ncbi:hypothetical protein HG536_0D00840 [Torulaspora globosa]|uniref:ubiquitinyl hydrolase 1 n=1 Tax=Torulaspora globosa TaxID=48254 RepID=A0A7G3ZGC6_9SACH|nr:uncharacterized protein HG536_0D00840 [Torulaspora globosa]QLL32562.1 hypothetical protein HG536_0D00840 [Torulaspora globosa]
MTTQETIKPLVDRILSNPLQFKKGRVMADQDRVELQDGPYVVIGKRQELGEGRQKQDEEAAESAVAGGGRRERRPQMPRSMAEAVSMYSRAGDESLSDVDVNAEGGSSGSGVDEEEFHEAKEYVEGEGEASGEDLGASMSSDEAFGSDLAQSSGSLSDSQDDVSRVSDSERAQLQEEALEASAAAEAEDDDGEELRHKLPASQRSITPPTTIGDIGNFYQVNENPHDTGSSGSGRIVKNWGPQLALLRPRGLLNHGVTCYTNAAVQAMVHIPAVQHYLFDILRGKYDSTISRDSVSYVLAETSRKMWLPQDKNKKKQMPYHVNPKKLIGRLHDINCMMSEWQQEDSHEYFMSLMSRLQEDSVPRGHKLTESIIYDIFGGLLKQVVTCKSCGGVSKTEQPFYDLSLHLKGKKKPASQTDSAGNEAAKDQSGKNESNGKELGTASGSRRFSIEKAIKDFFTPELIRVDKEQKGYVCEKCHRTTNATKHNSIMRAPETLLIHLKKFRFNGTSSSKIKQAVSYPMFLDLTEYCEPDEKNHVVPAKYQLTTVVVHEGRSLSSGHYIVHCRQPDGSWAIYDDEYLNKITERDVLKEPNAYYLLYTRLTPKEVKSNHRLNLNDLDISLQTTGSSSNSNTPSSSPILNNRSKKWRKNKKRRFNRY